MLKTIVLCTSKAIKTVFCEDVWYFLLYRVINWEPLAHLSSNADFLENIGEAGWQISLSKTEI